MLTKQLHKNISQPHVEKDLKSKQRNYSEPVFFTILIAKMFFYKNCFKKLFILINLHSDGIFKCLSGDRHTGVTWPLVSPVMVFPRKFYAENQYH